MTYCHVQIHRTLWTLNDHLFSINSTLFFNNPKISDVKNELFVRAVSDASLKCRHFGNLSWPRTRALDIKPTSVVDCSRRPLWLKLNFVPLAPSFHCGNIVKSSNRQIVKWPWTFQNCSLANINHPAKSAHFDDHWKVVRICLWQLVLLCLGFHENLLYGKFPQDFITAPFSMGS